MAAGAAVAGGRAEGLGGREAAARRVWRGGAAAAVGLVVLRGGRAGAAGARASVWASGVRSRRSNQGNRRPGSAVGCPGAMKIQKHLRPCAKREALLREALVIADCRGGTCSSESVARIWLSSSATSWKALPPFGSTGGAGGWGAERGAPFARTMRWRGVARRQSAGEGRGRTGGAVFGFGAARGQAASRSCQRVLAMEERILPSPPGIGASTVHLSIPSHPRREGFAAECGAIFSALFFSGLVSDVML